jgi:hypothetical protein
MELPQIFNVIGLSLDFIGVTMLLIWAPIQPNLQEGINLGLEDATTVGSKTVIEHNKVKRIQKKKIHFRSRVGFVLILIGFLIQIISNCF